VPRIVEIKQMRQAKKRFETDEVIKNDLRLRSSKLNYNKILDWPPHGTSAHKGHQ